MHSCDIMNLICFHHMLDKPLISPSHNSVQVPSFFPLLGAHSNASTAFPAKRFIQPELFQRTSSIHPELMPSNWRGLHFLLVQQLLWSACVTLNIMLCVHLLLMHACTPPRKLCQKWSHGEQLPTRNCAFQCKVILEIVFHLASLTLLASSVIAWVQETLFFCFFNAWEHFLKTSSENNFKIASKREASY